jgi:hypothetical protein
MKPAKTKDHVRTRSSFKGHGVAVCKRWRLGEVSEMEPANKKVILQILDLLT